MNNYTITVNGNVYDVVVEEGASTGAVAAAPKAAPKAPAGAQGGVKIAAPMPGKILNVKVAPGQAVKYGEVVIIMEAMKMETEIVAPADGTVAQVLVQTGAMVDTGAALVSLNLEVG